MTLLVHVSYQKKNYFSLKVLREELYMTLANRNAWYITQIMLFLSTTHIFLERENLTIKKTHICRGWGYK